MSQRLLSAGASLSYCVETTAGTRPTSGYTKVPEVKTTPSTNQAPNAIDVTDLAELEQLQYILGLRDTGGVYEFTANLTADLITAWNTTLVGAYETAATSGKATWFCISHPKLPDMAYYFKGEPSKCSFNEIAVNAALETTLYVAYQGGADIQAAPTFVSA